MSQTSRFFCCALTRNNPPEAKAVFLPQPLQYLSTVGACSICTLHMICFKFHYPSCFRCCNQEGMKGRTVFKKSSHKTTTLYYKFLQKKKSHSGIDPNTISAFRNRTHIAWAAIQTENPQAFVNLEFCRQKQTASSVRCISGLF